MKKLTLTIGVFLLMAAYAITDPYYHSLEQTATNLGISGVYTSSVYDVTTYKTLDVNVTADQDSASNGLKINFVRVIGDCSSFTPGASNMDYTANSTGWSYSASTKDSYSASVRGNCAWVTYTNGVTGQGSFELTIFGTLK